MVLPIQPQEAIRQRYKVELPVPKSPLSDHPFIFKPAIFDNLGEIDKLSDNVIGKASELLKRMLAHDKTAKFPYFLLNHDGLFKIIPDKYPDHLKHTIIRDIEDANDKISNSPVDILTSSRDHWVQAISEHKRPTIELTSTQLDEKIINLLVFRPNNDSASIYHDKLSQHISRFGIYSDGTIVYKHNGQEVLATDDIKAEAAQFITDVIGTL